MDKRFKQYLALMMSVLLVFSTFEFSSIALDSVGDANTKAANVEEETDTPPADQTPSAPANDNDGGSDAAAPAGGGETETPAVTEEPAAENVEKAPADAGTDEGSQFRTQEADDPAEDDGEGDIPEEEANKLPGEPEAVSGLTYSGSAQELVTRGEPVTVKGRTYYWMTRISGDSDWHRSIPTATEAGTYVVEYKLSRHKSWKGFRYGTVEVTIDPARLSVEWNDQSVFVYNGEKQSPTYTLYGIQGGNVPYLTYHFTGSGGYDSDESPTEVGRYTMSVALPDSESNYIMKSSSKKFAIVEAKDEPEGIDRVYDGHHHYLTSYVRGYMYSMSPDGSFSYKRPVRKNAGEYTVYYRYGRKGEVKAITVTISPAELELVWDEETEFAYDGEPHSPGYTLNGVIGKDDPEIALAYAGRGAALEGEPSEPGRYIVKASLAENEGNYTMEASSKKFSIVEEREEPTGNYVTYNGHGQYLVTAVEGYMYSMSPDGPFSYKRPARKNAGEYTVYYRYGRKGEVSETAAEILMADLKLIWDDETTFDYDGEPHSPGYTLEGVMDGDDPQITIHYFSEQGLEIEEPSEPGTYTASASASERNYFLVGDDVRFSIVGEEPGPEPSEEPQARELTYDGQPHYLASYVRGYQYSLSPEEGFSNRRPVRRSAGEYTVYYRFGDNGVTKELVSTISPKALDVSWEPPFEFDEDGDAHAPEATLSGVVRGDRTPGYSYRYFSDKGLEVEKPSAAGSYTAQVVLDEGTRNYTLDEDSASQSFSITGEEPGPEPGPSEEPQAIDRTYDGSRQPLVTRVSGYRYSLSPDGNFSRFRPRATDAGFYVVFYKNGRDGEVKATTVRITPAKLNLIWKGPFEFDYDGEPHTPGYTLDGVIDGDDPEIVFSYTEGIRAASDEASGAPVEAGDYNVSASLAEGETNYTMQTASTNFSIIGEEPGPEPSEEPQARELTYDGQPHYLASYVRGYQYSLSPEEGFSNRRPVRRSAGEYTVYYRFGDNGVTKELVSTISPKALDVSWEPPFEFDEDGDAHAPEATLSGVVRGDRTPGYSYRYFSDKGLEVEKPSAAGSYTAQVVLDEGVRNYTLSEDAATQDFTINGEEPGPEPPVADEPQAIDRTYDGSRQPLVTRVSGYRYSLSPDGSFSRFRPRATDAGEYTVYYRYGRNGTVKSVDVTIAPAELNLIWDEESLFDYDGAPHSPDYTLEGVMDGDDPEILVTYEGGNYKSPDAPTEVGDYTATAELSPDETNYTMESAGTSFSIIGEGPEPGPVRAEPQPRNRTYDGSRQPLVTYVRGYRYSLSPDGDFSLIRPRATDAGEYTVYYKYGRSGNVKPVKVVISPAEISLKWDDEKEFNYDGKPHAPGYTLEGVAASDDPEILVTYEGGNYKSPEAPTEKGEYTASAELSPNETNYTMQSSSTGFSIVDGGPEPGPVPAGPEAINRTYDGSTQPLVTRADGYRYSLSPDGDFSPFRPRAKDAGEYTVYFRYGDSEETGSVKVTVAKRPLTAEWIDPFEFEYDGEGHAPTARLRGRAYGDRTPDFTYRYLDQDGTVLTDRPVNANTKGNSYTAEVVLAEDVNNYVLDPETASHEFIIYPKKIGFEWSDLEFTYDGEAHAPTATATGVIAGETLDIPVTVKDGPAVDAGDYTARVGDLDDPNYEYPADADPETPFKIKPAEIIVKANDKEICYGDPAPALMPVTDEDVEITGLPAKGVAFNYNELLLNTPYRQGDDAGSYPIEVKKALQVVDGGQAVNDIASLNPNYIIKEYINGTLRVKHIPDVVPPEPVIYVYDGTDKTLAKPGSAGEGFVIEYACGETRPADDSKDWSTEINMATNAGDYTMWWRPVRKKLQGSGMMSAQEQEKDYDHGGSFISKILPRPVDISWDPLSFIYDGELHIPSPTVTNLVKDDECIVTADGAASAPGKHTAKALSLSNKNYTLEGGTGITAVYRIVKDNDADASGSSSDGSGSGTGVSGTRTGDSSHVIAWICSLILAAAAAAGLVLRRKFRNISK